MQQSHILLIGNAATASAKLLQQLAKQADVIVAADGGAGKALKSGVKPDFVVGDLDSVSKRDLRALQACVLNMVTQENTDLEKALLFITRALPVTQITLVGFVGGRWDFSLANILHIASYAKKVDITLAGDGWRMHLLTHPAQFTTKLKKRVSLVPLKNCTGVTLMGLKYPLKNEPLPVGTTRPLSNQTISKQFSVSLKRGVLLVYREI